MKFFTSSGLGPVVAHESFACDPELVKTGLG